MPDNPEVKAKILGEDDDKTVEVSTTTKAVFTKEQLQRSIDQRTKHISMLQDQIDSLTEMNEKEQDYLGQL